MSTVASTLTPSRVLQSPVPAPVAAPATAVPTSIAETVRRTSEARAAQQARARRVRTVVLLPLGSVMTVGFILLMMMLASYFQQQLG